MRSPLALDNCPAARALDVIGERWALLVVREALGGARRFDEFRDRLRMSENTLARRLAELTAAGVLMRTQYSLKPARFEYLLTERGRALVPVLAALVAWGNEWTDPDPDLPGPPARPSWLDESAPGVAERRK
ncbi:MULTISPECIES: helix-turn-helix domain-containing protein [unclassified Streptomyces]|uniref:winged helix-turn-helix transcriptional regulator n=1 Tax=unclassified Streptomyces TaxID=2593676 RepID=UPI001BE84EF1|nr:MULTISPECIES: helix-turn-helix domain-containing protein [unclassified Streptomyces]MBT2402895.1 helix-turn-helix transcriptional regulator [Streptomyces sp. ISL-21]MBT2449042.1 helix-turn-helix transcriptional regulator [Streptomyces sp. ISL-43]MBT2454848.1 helix-turn-helix transcriptional regulator [Streptomyces sp. ISL-86]MBT2545482.1 helix-turn-helix transcriptional regulator [Streptomyces sp. ISL-44]MBT2611999.1 helix-turn-helix transcriptional regulator [Streptomyces sp. ISL-87]